VIDDLFQTPKKDLFQDEFLPGRAIPSYGATEVDALIPQHKEQEVRFEPDKSNTSPWITVIYQSTYHAEKAAIALPRMGLNVYYPKCRYKEKEIQAQFDMMQTTKSKSKNPRPEFIPAYGRYLFIQLPEDAETLTNIEITEKMIGGRFNENGVVSIITVEGKYSLTLNIEILENDTYHQEQIRRTNPKVALRFKSGEVVRVMRGNIAGTYVRVVDDIFMFFKLSSKTEVILGNAGARHYVKVGDLAKC